MKTPTNRTIGVYAGSFDPLTVGHLWMIEQGMRLFDQLVVAIGINPEKQPTFSVAERLDMLKRSTAKLKNVKVDSFDYQFLIHYAQSVGAQFILRGIRGATDYEYERVMRNINGDLNPEITTLFLMPPRDIAEVSSGMVRGLIGPAGWQTIVKQYVPAPVHRQILAKHHGHAPAKKVG